VIGQDNALKSYLYLAATTIAIVISAIAASNTLWPQRANNSTIIDLLLLKNRDAIWCNPSVMPHALWASLRFMQFSPHRDILYKSFANQ
jgi:hypothetical protein